MSAKPILVAASVLSADFTQLGHECARLETAGADWLHLDVMDGHFVDNISFGQPIIEAVKKIANVPLDAHLMIERPDHFFPRFVGLVNNITIHVEPSYDVAGTLRGIRAAGCTAGLALSPPTSFAHVEPYLDAIDLLLVMTVNPGFGGQAFIPEMMAKVRQAVAIRTDRNLHFHIEVDGGIHPGTAEVARAAGANVLVAGTGAFKAREAAVAIQELRGAA